MFNNNLVLERVYFKLYFGAINFKAVKHQLNQMRISMVKEQHRWSLLSYHSPSAVFNLIKRQYYIQKFSGN